MEKSPRPGLGPRPVATPGLSPERDRVLRAVLDQPEPVSLAALVRSTGRHENTVREHLNALVAAGLIGRTAEHTTTRGRPRWRYHAGGVSAPLAEYAGLANLLAGMVARGVERPGDASSGDGPRTSHQAETRRRSIEAGEHWGREVARGRGRPVGGAAAEVVEVMRERGFAPEVDPTTGTDVRLTRCPLLETAHRYSHVVCSAHLGMARGMQAELGEDPDGTELVPFAEPGACVLALPGLRRTAAES